MIVKPSDRRIKQNIIDLPDPLATINQILPRQFSFIDDPLIVRTGFIAQEYINQFPNDTLVNGDNGIVPLGSNFPWGVETEVLIPYLVGAVKQVDVKAVALQSGVVTASAAATASAASASASAASAASASTSASSAATILSTIASLGTKVSASISNVTAAGTGLAKTVATLTIPSTGKWMVYGKCSVVSQVLTLTLFQTEVSISETTNTHNVKSRTRESFPSLLLTSRNIAPNPYHIEVVSTATVYMVMSISYTGTAPETVATDSELYAVKVGL